MIGMTPDHIEKGYPPPRLCGEIIELTPVEVLLDSHHKTLDRLIDCIAPETPLLHQALVRTLTQFARWVHQLPASETHHHSYRGGLLEHSLEVALWAAESARGRLGDLSLAGWERRRQERTFVLAVALSGLLHDLGKPVADLLILDASGKHAWNPYRSSLMDWALSLELTHYHLQWLRGRGARHRGFSLLILRSVVEPELFDRLREVGPELESSLLRALTLEGGEDEPASQLVMRADQESTVRSLRDPRRQTDFGGPSPERILIHAMRHLVHDGIWIPNRPGSPLWILDEGLYLVWPRAVIDIESAIDQDRFCGIPLDAELLMGFMRDRGLLAPGESEDEIPSPLRTIHPEGLAAPLRMLQLRTPRLLFDGILPESQKIRIQPLPDTQGMTDVRGENPIAENPLEKSAILGLPIAATPGESDILLGETVSPSSLKQDLQNASDRYEWQVRDHHLFIPHPDTAKALGMDPLALIEALDALDWLEPGGAGHVRKVRVIEGRRGLLLTRTVSQELQKAMKVPKRKSRRKLEVSA